MREIKFRAWDTIRKVMFSAKGMGEDQEALLPDGRGFANISSINTRLTQIHSHLLPLQYTGLKDKNGKEIYEGDICKHTEGDPEVNSVEYYCGEWHLSPQGLHLPDENDLVEVIGNIYENPELLK